MKRKIDVNTVREEKSKGIDIGLLVIPFLFIILALLVSPFYEFPLNDDWSYALPVKNLYEKGIFQSIGAANSFFHVLWGWSFVQLFGFSFSVLRVSTLLLHLMGSLALYKLFREIGCSITWSLFSIFLIIFNPYVFQLSYSFMTDVPYLSFLIIGLYFYYKGLNRGKNVFLLIGSLSSSIAFLIREIGIIFPVSVCIYLILFERRSLREKILSVIGIPIATLIIFEYWYFLIHGVSESLAFHGKTMMQNLMSIKVIGQFIERSFGVLYFLGLALLPLSAVVFIPLQRRIMDLSWKRIIFLIAISSSIVGVAVWRTSRGNYFPIDSLWTSGSFLGVMEGIRPAVIPYGGGKILFWLSVASSCVLVSWLYLEFSEKSWMKEKPLVFIIFLGFIQFCYLLAAPFFFQRYIIPFIPFVIMATSIYLKDSVTERPLIFALLIIPALFSVFTTKDSLTWNQLKWDTAKGLVKEGIPLSHIEAGIEWDCWNFYDYSKEHPNERPRRYFPVPWWLNGWASAIDPIYMLSFTEREGYGIFQRKHYQSSLFRTPREILVLVKEPPKTREGFEDSKKDFMTGWNYNLDRNILQLNKKARFISEGMKSLKCDLKTNSQDTFHYGGVKVKAPMNKVGFIFDLWVVNPKEVKKIFVYCYDDKGNVTGQWFRDVVADSIEASEKNTFYFSFGLSQDDFHCGGGSGEKTDHVDIFVESDKENANIIFYVDNFRT